MQNNGFGAISSKSKRVVFAGLSNSNIKSGGQKLKFIQWQLPLKIRLRTFLPFIRTFFTCFHKKKGFSSVVAFFWHQNELLTPPRAHKRAKTRFHALFCLLRTFLRTLRTFLRTFFGFFSATIFSKF